MAWKVFRDGEMIHKNPHYNIQPLTTLEPWIVSHMKSKVWVNMEAFLPALEKARKIVIELSNEQLSKQD